MRRAVIVTFVVVGLAATGALLDSSLNAAVSQTLDGTVNADYSITLVFEDGSIASTAPAP